MTLIMKDVVKKFGDHTAVNNLSLEIPEKQMFGFLGANGAGKTTTFRMILDLIKPTAGEIRWNGQKIGYEESAMIGYLPEERGLYPKQKINEQLVFLGKLRGMTKHDAQTELKRWLDKFEVPEYLDKKIDELSKGNQQKIQFIAAVIHRPKLLILDEPFSGLDPVNVELLKQAVIELKDSGTSIVFSSHRMEHVEELCQHLCIMDHGTPVVAGNLKEIKAAYDERVLLIDADFDTESLKGMPGVLSYKKDHRGVALKIENEAVAQPVFQSLAKVGFVRSFSVKEPSLNDIFIDKVGQRNG